MVISTSFYFMWNVSSVSFVGTVYTQVDVSTAQNYNAFPIPQSTYIKNFPMQTCSYMYIPLSKNPWVCATNVLYFVFWYWRLNVTMRAATINYRFRTIKP